ncbi:WcaI family glycosyltransferase [Seonamhaeicola sp. MEBiC1930]|uniref:WcaI family glycosyltransferase n=1 Tax=Seonamhaeicola sp. MEBiC01930 TaxID=2976768 RepID=UPI003255F5BD
MSNITIISGYFFPEDTAIGLYNTQMVDYLEDKGYKVSVITGFPSYPQWKIRDEYKDKNTFLLENLGSTKIYRYKQYVPSRPTFLKRILLLLDFTLGSLVNVLKIKECDLVISVVPHTTTMLLAWILKKRKKAKLWNHVQDFEFDAVSQTGISSKDFLLKRIIFKLLFKIESSLLNKGDINSTISHVMLSKLISKSKTDSYYFPNWIDINNINPLKENRHRYMPTNTAFNILYSGNIGDKQDWEFFLNFASGLENHNVNIIIVGDGARREWLNSKIKELSKVTYYPPVPYNELSSLLSSADLHILFQKNDVVDSVMPSKLLGMMASARPSLISGNEDSEVKSVISESKGGFYISDNSVKNCINIVEKLIESPKKAQDIGFYAREHVANKFSLKKVLNNFESTLAKILKE